MNRKVKVLILLAFLFVIVVAGSYSYSKYRSDITGTASTEIAKWDILVNDCHIVDHTKNPNDSTCYAEIEEGGQVVVLKNFVLSPEDFSYVANTYVRGEKIAPGGSADFLLRINPQNTEVSFSYQVSTQISDEDESLEYYIVENNVETLLSSTGGSYSGTMNYSTFSTSTDPTKTIRFRVKWINNPANNESDTQIGTKSSRPTLEIPIQITFRQIN